MQHVIGKQTLQFTIGSSLDKFHIQHVISNYYKRIIRSSLEKAFDKVSTQDEVVSLDKVEIDLGSLDFKILEEYQVDDRVEKILLEELTKCVKSGDRQATRKISTDLNAFQQWLFYLEKGYLPWNTWQTIDSVAKAIPGLLKSKTPHLNNLRKLVIGNANVVKRLIYQHSEKFLVQILEQLSESQPPDLPKVINELSTFTVFLQKTGRREQATTRQNFKEILWASILVQAAHKREFSPSYLVQQFTLSALLYIDPASLVSPPQSLAEKLSITLPGIKQIIKAKKSKAASFPEPEHTYREVFEQFFKPIEQIQGIKSHIAEKSAGEKENNIHTKIESDLKVEKDNYIEDIHRIEVKTEDSLDLAGIDEEGIFVQNAGLVLIHPFLEKFFIKLKLVREKNFINKNSCERSMYILHYLATGETRPEEHLLVIPKILCGFPISEPVKRGYKLSSKVIRETNEFLSAVISHWSYLKNTTPATLQREFLQRNGKINTKDDNLHLQIEVRSIDILLDKLPWNLDIIKLPWMKEILQVDWN